MAKHSDIVHANFEAAFTKGYVFKNGDDEIPMRQIEAGILVAPTGKIIACDPMFLESYSEPFTRIAPKGKHRVLVAIAKLWGCDERVACARIQFSRTKPVKWRLAVTKGQKLSDLKPNQFYGFGVDGGMGCYVDAGALDFEDSYQFTRSADSDLQNAMDRSSKKEGFCGIIPVRRWGGPTLIGFYSGLGDGAYPSFWGFDKHGKIATLDTDFGLLTECIEAEVIFDNILDHLNEELQDPLMKAAGFSVRVRKQRKKKEPIVVEEIGSPSNLSLTLFAGKKELHYRTYRGWGYDGTYGFEITAKQVEKLTSLRLRFTKGVRALS